LEKIMKSRSRTNKASFQGMVTRTALLLGSAVSLATLGFGLSANADERKTALITFNVPAAGTGAHQGTQGIAISPEGTITGWYFNAGDIVHGYVRARDGTFITFDAPGATTVVPQQGTFPYSINPAGIISGFYDNANGVAHGFVRTRDGAITTIDVPAAGTGAMQGTFDYNINPAGTIAGTYIDASSVSHGFVRAPDGGITTFDAPGAGTNGPSARAPLPRWSLVAAAGQLLLEAQVDMLDQCWAGGRCRRLSSAWLGVRSQPIYGNGGHDNYGIGEKVSDRKVNEIGACTLRAEPQFATTGSTRNGRQRRFWAR
jgi:hypothetical protein